MHLPGAMNQVADGESRTVQLDDPPTSVCTDQEEDGALSNGYVCISSNTSTSSLIQLEARSRGRSNRSLQLGPESVSGMCKPPIVSASAYTGKDSVVEGQTRFGSTNMEDTTMVSSPPPIIERDSTSDPNTREYCDFTNTGGVHITIRSATTSRLATTQHQG